MKNLFTRRVFALIFICLSAGPTALSAADFQSLHRPRPRAQELWSRTELYFGSDKHDGTTVSEAEFMQFVDQEVTPRFPDGLTVLTGYGQFFDAEGVIEKERSMILILFYPLTNFDAGKRIQEIRDTYKRLFRQESVLRVDSLSAVSF
jgi:Protein of unknown function (DUF3574)